MGRIFCLTVIIILWILCAIEIRRFSRARAKPDELPYPTGRLVRRLIIAVIFSAIVALVTFWPPLSHGVQLGLLLLVCVGLVGGLVLLWRDLHETSRALVDQAERLNKQTGEAFMEIFRKKAKESGGDGSDKGENQSKF